MGSQSAQKIYLNIVIQMGLQRNLKMIMKVNPKLSK